MDTIEIIHNALEWANKRLELQGEPITQNQRNYIVFALRQQLTIPAVSGSLLLHELFQVASIENEDGMSVIKYIDKPNGGSVAYIRHDAMVKKLNELLK